MTSRKNDPRYKPGTFVKGDATRVARTPAEAVKATFDGFKRQEESKTEAPESGNADATTDAPEKTVAETADANEGARTSAPKPGPKPPTGGAK